MSELLLCCYGMSYFLLMTKKAYRSHWAYGVRGLESKMRREGGRERGRREGETLTTG